MKNDSVAMTDSLPAPSGFVNAGSLAVFLWNTDEQTRRDVLDTCLFAQLSGDDVASRFDDPLRWFSGYLKTLRMVGWVLRKQRLPTPVIQSQYLTLQHDILNNLERRAPARQVDAVAACINSFNDLDIAAPPVGIFNANAWAKVTEQGLVVQSVNFQISVASTADGTPTMMLDAYWFSSTYAADRILSSNYPSGGLQKLKRSSMVARLNERHYGRHRAAVQESLAARGATYVSQIDMPSEQSLIGRKFPAATATTARNKP